MGGGYWLVRPALPGSRVTPGKSLLRCFNYTYCNNFVKTRVLPVIQIVLMFAEYVPFLLTQRPGHPCLHKTWCVIVIDLAEASYTESC